MPIAHMILGLYAAFILSAKLTAVLLPVFLTARFVDTLYERGAARRYW